MEGLPEDGGDGSMMCTEHPFKNNTPAGGICAFCLQEKLGKLVSSSFPIAVFPSSSSSSPSFRSDIGGTTTTNNNNATINATVVPPRLNTTSLLGSNTQIKNNNDCRYHQHHSNNHSNNHSNRSRILYLLGQKKKKNKDLNVMIDGGHDRSKNIAFKRSKSTAAGRRGGGGGLHYIDGDDGGAGGGGGSGGGLHSPHKRGFWSFLYLQKHSHSSRKTLRSISSNTMSASSSASATYSFPQRSQQHQRDIIIVEENESPNNTTFDRKVSRSRSVGCGSRSFSGDFFERISTFGDCTLRRVESHREGKPKLAAVRGGVSGGGGGQDSIQERVRCGGLFSGFMITSSSSSSSSSSNWIASNNEGTTGGNPAGKVTSAVAGGGHCRSKSWGWALASPMRAFSKQSSSSSSLKKEASKKNANPNLNAIPSLLSVSS